MKIIDLRSDTVTHPTSSMYQAMQQAELGDDVFGDDPTTIKLENLAAEITAKENGLLVPSGTMGNLIANLTHCSKGNEVLLGDRSHIFLYEVGGISALGGLFPHVLPTLQDGTMDLNHVEESIRTENIHFPRTGLICLENTHNYCGGLPVSTDYTEQLCELAHRVGLKVHLDGARIFNASIALNVSVRELCKSVDSVMFCLSKGLSAPIGSVLCGSTQFIEAARKNRKMLGGGMRQTGLIAAAGIVALNEMRSRLIEDHQHAKMIADSLAEFNLVKINRESVQTNIIYFNLNAELIEPDKVIEAFYQRNIRFLYLGKSKYRMVTHQDISKEDVLKVVAAVKEIFSGLTEQ